MYRKTKDKSLALERAVELTGGTVEPGEKRGHRRVAFDRPSNGEIVVEDRLPQCLYVVLTALTTSVDLGGFGMTWDEVREYVRYYGAPGGRLHERNAMKALRMREGR